MTPRLLALALALVLAHAGTARAQGLAPPRLGNESVATTDDAGGVFVNPAAGGLRYDNELVLGWTDLSDRRDAFTVIGSAGALSLGWRRVESGVGGTRLGFALGAEPGRVGLAFDWLGSDTSDAKARDLSFGLLTRPSPWLSLGYSADHLTEPSLDGATLDREHTVAAGVRPLALARASAHESGTRFTVSADLKMRERDALDRARLRIGAELEPVRGLVVRASVESGGFQIGLGLLAPTSSYHAQASFDADARRRSTTHSISVHDAEDRTVFAAKAMRRVATVRVAGDLVDDPVPGFSLLGGSAGGTMVAPIHRALDRALEDPLTRGVLLELRGARGMAQIEELRPRVRRLRDAGKPVVAWLEHGGGRGDLYLAAACDRVVTTPEAFFGALGLRAERRSYRRLLADWGLRIDRASHGRYKSAYREYSVDSVPRADREVIERQLDVSQELLLSSLVADRRVDRARLLEILDGRAWPPSDLAAARLVDSIGYREDALALLGGLTGLGAKPKAVRHAERPQARVRWRVPERIAIVYASGAIEVGRSGNDLLLGPFMGAETMAAQIEAAFRDPDVEAVVLRIESPGGSTLASNLIDHAVQRWRRETGKPLVVSMGRVAASGGYQIAVHGDRLFADRYTVTGSIGVLIVKPSIERWYAEHHVRQEAFERGAWMRGWSLGQDWDARLQASADSAIRRSYDGFVANVAAARRMSVAAVDSVAQGRTWMGEDARARGLVDEIGGLEDAVAEARRRAGIPPGERIAPAEYRRPRPGLVERALGGFVGSLWGRLAHLPQPGALYHWADVDDEE